MARAETDIVHDCMKAASECGARVGKNVRGMFRLLNRDVKVKGGLLMPGASDLIGWTKIRITPNMVNSEVAIFTSFEAKTPTGRPSPEQVNFLRVVKESGGISGIVRSPSDVKKEIENWKKNVETATPPIK